MLLCLLLFYALFSHIIIYLWPLVKLAATCCLVREKGQRERHEYHVMMLWMWYVCLSEVLIDIKKHGNYLIYILVLISTIQYRFYQLCFDSNILVPVFVDMLLVSIHACSKPGEALIHFLNIHIWKIHPIDHYISTAIVLFSHEKIEHIFLHILLKRKNLLCIFDCSCLWMIMILCLHLSNVYNIMKCAIKDLKYMYSTGFNQESSIWLRWAKNGRG